MPRRIAQCDPGVSELPAGSSGAVGRSAKDKNGTKGKRIWSNMNTMHSHQ